MIAGGFQSNTCHIIPLQSNSLHALIAPTPEYSVEQIKAVISGLFFNTYSKQLMAVW